MLKSFRKLECHNETQTLKIRSHTCKIRPTFLPRSSLLFKNDLPILFGIQIFYPIFWLIRGLSVHMLCPQWLCSTSIFGNWRFILVWLLEEEMKQRVLFVNKLLWEHELLFKLLQKFCQNLHLSYVGNRPIGDHAERLRVKLYALLTSLKFSSDHLIWKVETKLSFHCDIWAITESNLEM